MRRAVLSIATLMALPCLSGHLANAQEYPSKPIQFIVPFAVGGPADTMTRRVTSRLESQLKQPVIVENMTGATTIIGTQRAANSAADGYTMVVFSLSHSINAASGRSMPYDTLKDFTPVAMLGVSPSTLVVQPSLATTVTELVSKAQARKEPLKIATTGIGSSTHMIAELFTSSAGIPFTNVPYRGAGPALLDLAGGHVDATFADLSVILSYATSGRMNALAVTTSTRSAAAPDIPTLNESGFPGFQADSWIAVFAPARTPSAIVKKMNDAISAVLDDSELKKAFEATGTAVTKLQPQALGAYVAADIEKWRNVIQARGIKLE